MITWLKLFFSALNNSFEMIFFSQLSTYCAYPRFCSFVPQLICSFIGILLDDPDCLVCLKYAIILCSSYIFVDRYVNRPLCKTG